MFVIESPDKNSRSDSNSGSNDSGLIKPQSLFKIKPLEETFSPGVRTDVVKEDSDKMFSAVTIDEMPQVVTPEKKPKKKTGGLASMFERQMQEKQEEAEREKSQEDSSDLSPGARDRRSLK